MDVYKATEVVLDEVLDNVPCGLKVPANLKIKLFNNSPVAGKAKYPNVILINNQLAQLYPEQLRDTVIHELAHLITHCTHGKCPPHGPQWRDVMALLGVADIQRCHDMDQPDLVRKKQRRWQASCACREHSITTTRYMSIIMGERTYHCRVCKQDLTIKENQ